MDTITAAISSALLVEAIVAIIAGAYIVNLYLRRQGDSRFFRMLIQADILAVTAGAVIAAVIAGAFVDIRLPQPWGMIVAGSAIAGLMFMPIYHAWTLAAIRRARGDRTPPPLREGD